LSGGMVSCQHQQAGQQTRQASTHDGWQTPVSL
jgi:hypothetical protein